jgi:hypothetical protein
LREGYSNEKSFSATTLRQRTPGSPADYFATEVQSEFASMVPEVRRFQSNSKVPTLSFRLVRVLLGSFLVAAAGLKVHGLALGPSSDDFFLSPRLQIATIETETILGLWLLSGWSMRAARLLVLGFFAILAGTSFYLALAGQRSCGCFGRVAVNPWVTFTVDLAAMVLLLLCRPGPSTEMRPVPWFREILKTAVGAAAFLILIAGAFLMASDNPAKALARMRGESIVVEPGVSDVGEGQIGAERAFQIRLTNYADQPIRIIGGTTTCSCIATNSLPISLEQGETRAIDVFVKFRGSVGEFHHGFELFTDDETQPVVVARFVGRVIRGPE